MLAQVTDPNIITKDHRYNHLIDGSENITCTPLDNPNTPWHKNFGSAGIDLSLEGIQDPEIKQNLQTVQKNIQVLYEQIGKYDVIKQNHAKDSPKDPKALPQAHQQLVDLHKLLNESLTLSIKAKKKSVNGSEVLKKQLKMVHGHVPSGVILYKEIAKNKKQRAAIKNYYAKKLKHKLKDFEVGVRGYENIRNLSSVPVKKILFLDQYCESKQAIQNFEKLMQEKGYQTVQDIEKKRGKIEKEIDDFGGLNKIYTEKFQKETENFQKEIDEIEELYAKAQEYLETEKKQKSQINSYKTQMVRDNLRKIETDLHQLFSKIINNQPTLPLTEIAPEASIQVEKDISQVEQDINNIVDVDNSSKQELFKRMEEVKKKKEAYNTFITTENQLIQDGSHFPNLATELQYLPMSKIQWGKYFSLNNDQQHHKKRHILYVIFSTYDWENSVTHNHLFCNNPFMSGKQKISPFLVAKDYEANKKAVSTLYSKAGKTCDNIKYQIKQPYEDYYNEQLYIVQDIKKKNKKDMEKLYACTEDLMIQKIVDQECILPDTFLTKVKTNKNLLIKLIGYKPPCDYSNSNCADVVGKVLNHNLTKAYILQQLKLCNNEYNIECKNLAIDTNITYTYINRPGDKINY